MKPPNPTAPTLQNASREVPPDHANNASIGAVPTAAADDDNGVRTARLFLEDFVVTALLRMGRPLRGGELTAAAEGFSLSRAALREGLAHSQRLTLVDREWDLTLRAQRRALSREERGRQPLEGTLDELLRVFGKPLPVPVIARELATMRGVVPATVRDAVTQILRTSRFVVAVNQDAWLHDSFIFDTHAPTDELIRRVNRVDADSDFRELQEREFPVEGTTLAERAAAVLRAAERPLSQKVLGFLLWQQGGERFDGRELARALGDRRVFYSMLDGYVTLQAQLPLWRAALNDWMRSLGTASAETIDVVALLRHRVAPGATIAPREEEIEELKKFARQMSGQPFSIVSAMTDLLEMEPDNPQFVPALQGLNDALRRNPTFLPTGIGRFVLRESVPSYVGEVPEELHPVHLSVRDPETDEPLDVEMSDDGLEGDAVEFVHAPQWEDVNEEVEVKLPRRSATEAPTSTRYVILNHHHRAGTLKLRRMDEDLFAISGALSRLSLTADDGSTTESIGAWASRESGLIYGLGEWFTPRTPQSGGVLLFSREAASGNPLRLTLGDPDKLTLVTANRTAELETLRDPSAYLSLFELLQNLMSEHQQGAELPTLWAEINVVRRTTKRLLCSVLSAYHCFYFKQRGPKQILWRFDAGKLDQGFKRNKRKYVRR
ncbi:MAG: hypothetical protein M3347_00890 [Armatimonadota bacterium]|nr:hypothetical protein [Armatimonadota bacterium]